jgi:lysophospholipase L1-like esterase
MAPRPFTARRPSLGFLASFIALVAGASCSSWEGDSDDDDAETGGSSGASTGGSSGASTGGSSGASTGGSSGASTGGSSGASTGGSSGASGSAGSGTGGAGGSGGTGISGPVFPPDVTRPRIMIVGDSISAGPGCYKKYLVQNLTANELTEYEFVGEYTDDCGGGVRHSAVSCTTSGQYTQESFMTTNCTAMTSYPGMATLVETHDPDLVMIQLGVNDVWGGSAPIQPILNNYSTLVEQARAHNPRVVVMVAQIHKIITNNCMNMQSTTNAEQLVTAIPAWAAGISTEDSPVLVADLWTNSDPMEATDCVHPNDAGARRMGENWYNALAPILR